MKGQWIGHFSGTSTGKIIVNVDELHSCFRGVAYIHNSEREIPPIAARFISINKDTEFELQGVHLLHFDREANKFGPYANYYAKVKVSWNPDNLTLSWITNRNETGNCILPRTKAHKESELEALFLSWDEYKDYVNKLEGTVTYLEDRTDPGD